MFFHLAQFFYKKIVELKVDNIYEKISKNHLYCNQLKALAFLPPNQIVPAFESLIENFPPGFEELIEYFDIYYVYGNFKGKTQNKNIHDSLQYAHTL